MEIEEKVQWRSTVQQKFNSGFSYENYLKIEELNFFLINLYVKNKIKAMY